MSQRLTDLVFAAAIFVGSLVILLVTTDVGITRDEGFYFRAASEYVEWFKQLWRNLLDGELATSFTRENIDEHWSYNPEHPALMKALFGLSHLLFHDTLGVLSPSTAWRLPSMISASFLLCGVYLFTRQLAGRLAGLVAVVALFFQPRFFFHAHLACFDVPIAALWFWVAYAYWRSWDSNRWALATGLLFGVALSVKLNAFFLPIVLVVHWVMTRWRQLRIDLRSEIPRLNLPPIPKAFWSMLLLGPLVFYALWPRIWFDTFERVRWYMAFHLEHEHYYVQFFGQNLQVPPFPVSYPWVMTLVTVPAVILLAFAIGAAARFYHSGQWKRLKDAIHSLRNRRWPDVDESADSRGTGVLIALNVVVPIAIIAMPDTPIFGGTKHWMPAMPFVAMLAGMGVVYVAFGLRGWVELFAGKLARWIHPAIVAGLVACVLVPASFGTAYNHPHGTSYYNELIGSYRGAADNRMFRQFWGHSSRHGLDWLNEHADDRDRIWIHNTMRIAWSTYQREGLVRDDLRPSGQTGSDYGLYHQQKAFMYVLLPLWEEYHTMAPAYVVDIDGVPLLSIYARPGPEELKYPEVWR